MKKKLTIALSSVIGTIALATAIAVPVTLQQKNKNKPLIINNDSSIITKPIDMDDNSSPMKSEPVDMDELKLNDGNKMMDDNPSPMKSEPVDLSSLINKASFGLFITNDSLPTEKEIINLVKKENPGLNEKALHSLSVKNISKQGSTITSKNKDDFSGEIKLKYLRFPLSRENTQFSVAIFFYKKNIIYYTFMLKYDIIKTWRSRKMMQKDNEEHQ